MVKDRQEIFDRQHIGKLIEKALEDWGDPTWNSSNAIRTGIDTLDNIIFGFDEGLSGIIGPSGSRKSTLMYNMIMFNLLSKRVDVKIPQVVFSSESGMSPSKCRDILIAMRATQYLRVWKSKGELPLDTPPYLFVNFFRYHVPNEIQERAIKCAMRDLSDAPLWVLGSGKYGGADNLSNYRGLFEAAYEAVDGPFMAYVDHIHSITVPGIRGDYERLTTVVPELAGIVKSLNCPCLALAQLSYSSQKADSPEARGGTVFREECNTYLGVSYDRVGNSINVFVDKARYAQDKVDISVGLEPNSGLVLDGGVLRTAQRVSIVEESMSNGQLSF